MHISKILTIGFTTLALSFNACSSSSSSAADKDVDTDLPEEVVVPTIVSTTTSRIWMDRNLGASRACLDMNDTLCYGDYYQWGRDTDGHEKFDSDITSIVSESVTPNHNKFIIGTLDWTPADDHGEIRTNNWNPCPTGFTVPTEDELKNENILDEISAFKKLKLPSAGNRLYLTGDMNGVDSFGDIWGGTDANTNSIYLHYYSTTAYTNFDNRANGRSVRCIKEQ